MKTIEQVVEETPWQPAPRLRDEDLVPVCVGYEEKELQQRLKAANGKWDPQAKLCHVPYGAIKGTELEAKIPAEFMKRKHR